MLPARRLLTVAFLAALACAVAPLAEAQPPIRIGAALSQTGAYAALGQNLLGGYQLCVKHTNDKGGVLGRKLELVVYDDRSDPATAVRLYEKLITQDKVDLVLGPITLRITNAVADVAERHKMPMVGAPHPSVKGRKFIFGVGSPVEVYLEGLLDVAARKGLKTVALIGGEDPGGRAVRQGALELAKKKGLQVVFVDAFPVGTTDFSTILTRIRAANPDVLGVSTAVLEDALAITRGMKALDVSPRMVGFTPGVAELPKFYEVLRGDAEFVYVASPWLPELVEVRAGGLIPIARQYPGVREFVESSRKEFPGAAPPARGYGACRFSSKPSGASGLWTGPSSATPLQTWTTTPSTADSGSIGMESRSGTEMLLVQWQDGKRAIVWPEELAPDKPRFPTPPWNQRP